MIANCLITAKLIYFFSFTQRSWFRELIDGFKELSLFVKSSFGNFRCNIKPIILDWIWQKQIEKPSKCSSVHSLSKENKPFLVSSLCSSRRSSRTIGMELLAGKPNATRQMDSCRALHLGVRHHLRVLGMKMITLWYSISCRIFIRRTGWVFTAQCLRLAPHHCTGPGVRSDRCLLKAYVHLLSSFSSQVAAQTCRLAQDVPDCAGLGKYGPVQLCRWH